MSGFDKLILAFYVAAGAGIAGSIGAGVVYVAQPNEEVRFTLEEKIVKPGNKSSKYLLFTDKSVFENTDSYTRWKFDSSDIQAQIKEGCTYDATVFGYRNNFLSAYKDVLTIKHVPTDKCPAPKPPTS